MICYGFGDGRLLSNTQYRILTWWHGMYIVRWLVTESPVVVKVKYQLGREDKTPKRESTRK
jgi:hypothetical protein